MLCAHTDTSNNQMMSFGIEKKPGMIAQGKYNLLLDKWKSNFGGSLVKYLN